MENNLNTYIWSIVLLREFQVLLSFDELYMYLEQPLMAKYISYFARRSRKYNACIGVATQQLQDCWMNRCDGTAPRSSTCPLSNSCFTVDRLISRI